MGLKKKIEEAYKKWESVLNTHKKHMYPPSNNCLAVAIKTKKLKNDLCKFADDFDKNFTGIIANPLKEKTISETYKDIRYDFVGRIAKEKNNFVYGIDKNRLPSFMERYPGKKEEEISVLDTIQDAKSEYPDSIKKYNSKYESLKSNFEKSKDLIDFFEEISDIFNPNSKEHVSWDNSKIGLRASIINSAMERFISEVFNAMAEELKQKERILIARDDEYFELVPNMEAACKGKDPKSALNKIMEMFSGTVKQLEKNEKFKQLLPNFWESLNEAFEKEIQSAKEMSTSTEKPSDRKHLPLYMGLLMGTANESEDVDKHLIGEIGNDVKVFPQGKPLPLEVKQAGIGDCFLMSTLISLAKSNPKAIEQCFVQGLDRVEKENNITIRFFSVKGNSEFKAYPIKITVNKKAVVMPQEIKENALWPKLIEKAYAIYRKERYELPIHDKDGKNLHGGSPLVAIFAITGKSVATAKNEGTSFKLSHAMPANSKKEKFKPENIIATIKNKLGKGRALTCDFKAPFKARDVKNHELVQVHTGHCYAIVGINESQKYIRLIEPNKAWGRTYSAKPINADRMEPPKEGGHVAMSFDDFKNNFSSIDYTTGKNW